MIIMHTNVKITGTKSGIVTLKQNDLKNSLMKEDMYIKGRELLPDWWPNEGRYVQGGENSWVV